MLKSRLSAVLAGIILRRLLAQKRAEHGAYDVDSRIPVEGRVHILTTTRHQYLARTHLRSVFDDTAVSKRVHSSSKTSRSVRTQPYSAGAWFL